MYRPTGEILHYGVGSYNPPKFLTQNPGVYKIAKNPIKGYPPILEFKYKQFTLPPRLYGELPKLGDFFFEGFKRRNYKGGVILTGEAGSGKTELAKYIANKAIREGLRVIDLSNTNLTEEMLDYLDTIDEIVLFFDEFGKITRGSRQDKLLTFFSNPRGLKRIIIITENEKAAISPYIRNRPGRIRYSKHFDKVPLSTVKDYLDDKDVDEDFYQDVLELYKRMPRFAFDHLQAIVDEYLTFPNLTLKEILEILNLDFITGMKEIKVEKVYIKGIEAKVVSESTLALNYFLEYNQRLSFNVKIDKELVEKNNLLEEIKHLHDKIKLINPIVNQQQGMFMDPTAMPVIPSAETNEFMFNITVGKDDIKEFIDDRMVLEVKDDEGRNIIEVHASVKLSYESSNISALANR